MTPHQEIPLFPLNVVLFPTARLPLRIFEDRYKKLFEDTLKSGQPFGIVLIKEGPEVGGTAVPHDVGTFVEIEAVDYQKDSIFVLCRGTRRFRIHELKHDRPYLVGRVEAMPELSAGPNPERLTQPLLERYEEYVERMKRVAAALGGELQAPKTPHGRPPQETVYAIASTIPLAPEEKQRLLEVPQLDAFVDRLQGLLEHELEFLHPDKASESAA